MVAIAIDPLREQIASLCARWKIQECSLFGSVLRDDFNPGSDIDLLVSFEPDAQWDLWDVIAAKEEFQQVFGREVDLVEEKNLKNPFRRHSILSQRQVIYDTRRT